ncbi:unnamed protein product [Strongylus vulgaris]|uniref:Uncharacterized protein n=1 Tax=Strongylus vulgaris TaxID=40348 RepID=A0A3P7LNR7_STRVU|nr:unnamed protein product [Strongylus vulgaris]
MDGAVITKARDERNGNLSEVIRTFGPALGQAPPLPPRSSSLVERWPNPNLRMVAQKPSLPFHEILPHPQLRNRNNEDVGEMPLSNHANQQVQNSSSNVRNVVRSPEFLVKAYPLTIVCKVISVSFFHS